MKDFLKDLAVSVIAFGLTSLIVFGMDKLLFGKFVHVQECIPMVIGFDSTYYDMGNATLDVNAFVTRGELLNVNKDLYDKTLEPEEFGNITVCLGTDSVHLTYYNTYDLPVTAGLAKVACISTSSPSMTVNGIAIGDTMETVVDKMGEQYNKSTNKFGNVDKLVYESTDDSMCVTFDFDDNGRVIYLSVDNYNIADLKEEFTVAPEPKY